MGCTSTTGPTRHIDAKDVTVLQALRDVKRFVFNFDVGNNWEHDVVVEELRPVLPISAKASVIPAMRSTRTRSSG
jgi:hypothetical protein